MDVSIKNQVAISIAHIHSKDNLVIKTVYYIVNVMSTKAEPFAIRCDINQVTHIFNMNWIIIIIDSIYTTKRIFDLSSHLYQQQSVSISYKLREFFKKGDNNLIKFWNCPNNQRWNLYNIINREIKNFNLMPIFPYKSSWNFSRKNECNNILNNWRMTF